MSVKKEYGDFQTPNGLATRCVALVAEIFGAPDFIIEPTVGLGTFLKAAAEKWGNHSTYRGYEINHDYVLRARKQLTPFGIQIQHRDFFSEDWTSNLARMGTGRILVIGNPPWVTNSDLGQLGSENLPKKTNFQGLRGMDARTGKSNFDIAECMLIRLIDALPSNGAIAMLCKTMTARKVLRHFWRTEGGLEGARLFHIDAKAEFDVAVDACLFFATGERTRERIASVHDELETASVSRKIGFVDGDLVSDMVAYQTHRNLDRGSSIYTWRSGVKHDAARVMEFTRDCDKLFNGYGEEVDIEDEYVYPLLKSSDLGNGRLAVRKSVLVTQRHTSHDTCAIEQSAPKTWSYLLRHAKDLDGRKSSIYKRRPRFSIFGVGPYAFAPWKVAVSGLYKAINFVVVPPCEERAVLLDDTCYFLSCRSREEAELLCELLSSSTATSFLKSLVFADSKRPVTVDVLRRLSFVELARELGKMGELRGVVELGAESARTGSQIPLLL